MADDADSDERCVMFYFIIINIIIIILLLLLLFSRFLFLSSSRVVDCSISDTETACCPSRSFRYIVPSFLIFLDCVEVYACVDYLNSPLSNWMAVRWVNRENSVRS